MRPIRRGRCHDRPPTPRFTATTRPALVRVLRGSAIAAGARLSSILPAVLALDKVGYSAAIRATLVRKRGDAMIRALVTGKLHDAPQARTSATGNTFAICKVKADDKNGAWVWVSVIAFGAEAERLLTLKQGDTVAIGGRTEIGAWSDKDGNPHGSLSLVADELATLRGKPRPPSESRQPSRRPARQPEPAGVPFDDLDDWQP